MIDDTRARKEAEGRKGKEDYDGLLRFRERVREYSEMQKVLGDDQAEKAADLGANMAARKRDSERIVRSANDSARPGFAGGTGNAEQRRAAEAERTDQFAKSLLSTALGMAFGLPVDLAELGKALVTGTDLAGQEVGAVDIALMGMAVVLDVVEPVGGKSQALRALAKAVENSKVGEKAVKGLSELAGFAPKIVDKLASKSPRAADALGNALAKGGEVVQKSADQLNAPHSGPGRIPPYKTGTLGATVTLGEDAPDLKFFRASKENGKPKASWGTMEDPSSYDSLEDYMDGMGMDKSNPPTEFWYRTGEAGDTFNVGEVAPAEAWGTRGGGTQVEFVGGKKDWKEMDWPWGRP
jgi:hypothetical protein